MNGYDIIFLALSVVVGWRVRSNYRALSWLAAGAASYIASAAWYRMGGPSPIIAAAACDAIVIIAIYAYAVTKWEMGLWRIFQAMLAINIIAFAAGASQMRNVLAGSLDVANAAALAWIWINGAKQYVGATGRLGKDGKSPYALRGVRRFILALRRERSHPPFWKVHN